jgi:hypothetical protein
MHTAADEGDATVANEWANYEAYRLPPTFPNKCPQRTLADGILPFVVLARNVGAQFENLVELDAVVPDLNLEVERVRLHIPDEVFQQHLPPSSTL